MFCGVVLPVTVAEVFFPEKERLNSVSDKIFCTCEGSKGFVK